jgi:hypothetical protein
MYAYIVLLHVIGAFVFALSHGVSVAVGLRLRGVRSREQVASLLELSGMAIGGLYVGLVLLLIGGIWAGFVGDHWGSLWIWMAIGILVVVMIAMYAIATPFYSHMRAAAGVLTDPKQVAKFGEFAPDELERMGASSRPIWLAVIGSAGLLAILWLMVVKPF